MSTDRFCGMLDNLMIFYHVLGANRSTKATPSLHLSRYDPNNTQEKKDPKLVDCWSRLT